MFRLASCLTAVVVLCAAGPARAETFGTGVNTFDIDFAIISGSTNPTVAQASAGELDGFGIVNYDYRMGMYEITNDQWDKFEANLAPVLVTGDPLDAYDEDPAWTGTNVATNQVSWCEAAQFVNWLNTSEGHPAAYNFTGIQGESDYALSTWTAANAAGGTNLYRHKDAFYFLPTEDEWVKAAYWNGVSLQGYATKNNGIPDEWRINRGPNSDGQAAGWNYGDAYPDNSSSTHQPWDVTAGYSPEELNGTFDMMGNVWEWLESPYSDPGYSYAVDLNRGLRGGSFQLINHVDDLHARYRYDDVTPPDEDFLNVGFRVASIPEPGSITLLLCGAVVLLTYCGRRKAVTSASWRR